MKLTFTYFLLVVGLATSCRDDEGGVVSPIAKPITFVTIDANVTDFLPDYSSNGTRVRGELRVEENYFVDSSTNGFTLNSGSFLVDYKNKVIRESMINQHPMCINSFNDCGELAWPIASLWQWVGPLSATDTLVWQYLDDEDPTKGYRWVMTEKPQQIRVTSIPPVLRPGQPQTISFEKASDEDYLRLELVTISKERLREESTIPVVPHSRMIYNPSAWLQEGNQVTLPSDQIDLLFYSRFALAETDTAFWNVASVRKIVKEINGTRFQLTYQVNNLTPVRIGFE